MTTAGPTDSPRPARERPAPTGTYRLQLTPDFGFDDAAAVVPYLADLGVSHVYCSPWLQAAPGSQHGYDVVDHSRISADLGGPAAHARLVAAAHAAGLGIVLDIVPNHSAVAEPESLNPSWWGLLRDGREGEFGSWYDVDWDAQDGRVLMPVLGAPLAAARGELRIDTDAPEPVLRYYDHVVPLPAGATTVDEALSSAHWRLADWHLAGEDLNYRRFFDVTTLAGLRVEDPAVFAATHALILEQVRSGAVDGLRIDHPDGLADPEGYLARLAEATGGAWTVVEKILEPGERLPGSWATAGTTGYDVLNRVVGLFVDPAGEQALTRLYGEVTGEPTSYAAVVETCKRLVLDRVLGAELNRLTGLLVAAVPEGADVTRRALHEALVELLVAFDVYRAYVTPGVEPDPVAVARVDAAVAAAVAARPERAREVAIVADLALRGPAEIVTRFGQTCGPAMAKGVEDTAFYRYHRLDALNEVGGDPGHFGCSTADFHAACREAQDAWPLAMTTLSTHDTKRSEDVRARLVLLAGDAARWSSTVGRLLELSAPHASTGGVTVDRNAHYLFLQTVVGAWPLSAERAVAYLEKATREAKQHTSWTEADPAYDAAVQALVRGALADPAFTAEVEAYVDALAPLARATSLAMKLVQLTMPGIPDVYQGTELTDLSLVDPDNRRPVDYDARRGGLATLADAGAAADGAGGGAVAGGGGDAKLRLVATALRLRRELPEAFGAEGAYEPLDAGDRAVAFCRGGRVVTVAARLPGAGDADAGGADTGGAPTGGTVLTLPAGSWVDRLRPGSAPVAGEVAVATLLGDGSRDGDGVALLVRQAGSAGVTS